MAEITVNGIKYEYNANFIEREDKTVYFIYEGGVEGVNAPFVGYFYGKEGNLEHFVERTIREEKILQAARELTA